MDDILTLKRGQPLNLALSGLDAEGLPCLIPDGWTAASRACFGRADGPEAFVLAPTIVSGEIRLQRVTTDLAPATYVFDVKLLDAGGLITDVSANITLILEPSPSTP